METPQSGHFPEVRAAFESLRPGDEAWLKELRAAAFERFQAAGLPTRRQEEWKYTSIKEVIETAFVHPQAALREPARVPGVAEHFGEDDIALVFVDGVLSTAYTRTSEVPKGLTVMTLDEATRLKQDELLRLVRRPDAEKASAFAALAEAFLGQGAYIEVSRGATPARTIHLVHVTAGVYERPPAFFPRHLVLLREGAEARVVETFLGQSESPYFVNAATDIELEANARLVHVRVQAEGAGAYHMSRTRALLARDARLSTVSFASGSRINRNDLAIVLAGPGAQAELDGLYLVRGKQLVDNHTTVDHRVPDATSTQLYKGVIAEQGRGVFNGKIFVREDAQRTNAYQLNRNLLLSSEAEIDTKPELQIEADDVKCTHGAAVGQLDQGQLFYLQSRGLKPADAVRLLSTAFVDEVLLKVDEAPVRERLRHLTKGFFV